MRGIGAAVLVLLVGIGGCQPGGALLDLDPPESLSREKSLVDESPKQTSVKSLDPGASVDRHRQSAQAGRAHRVCPRRERPEAWSKLSSFWRSAGGKPEAAGHSSQSAAWSARS